ncbi:uncharacterized protein LOC120351046 [Nilaparvata lugens]|uniref:uncharacterized protein LOC120351046 n=1 Tax=Nilaparvata lugens TaxID=108931 RepID=UPI00193E9CF0|nr:uncharacterized protein LOC120351046 [Nilaparvata lugens]
MTEAVQRLVVSILEAMEKKHSTAITLCDLTKAFYCVSHEILLGKLMRYGVGGVAMKTMQEYLLWRRQVLTISGAKSQELQVKYGVPQGSILDLLLFLIFINDLSMDGEALLFADDTTLIAQEEDPRLAVLRSAELLEEASTWFRANRLYMNGEKTQNVLCTLRHGLPPFGGPEVKLLGFMVDSSLIWDQHIDMICNRLSKVTYLIPKLRSHVPRSYLVTAYHDLFHSHINNGIALWGHASGCHRILLLQKKVICIITPSPYLEHCHPLFRRLGILTVFNQYVLNSLVLLKGQLHTLQARGQIDNYSTRGRGKIDLPLLPNAHIKNLQ